MQTFLAFSQGFNGKCTDTPPTILAGVFRFMWMGINAVSHRGCSLHSFGCIQRGSSYCRPNRRFFYSTPPKQAFHLLNLAETAMAASNMWESWGSTFHVLYPVLQTLSCRVHVYNQLNTLKQYVHKVGVLCLSEKVIGDLDFRSCWRHDHAFRVCRYGYI